jgi:hypothetical protein
VVQKTTEDKVLDVAKNESKNITLVYASEKAMEFKLETQALPGPLDVRCLMEPIASVYVYANVFQAFVRADNRSFKQELIENDTEDSSTQASLPSPGKRKFKDDSEESQDSITARYGGPTPPDSECHTSQFERDMGENGELFFNGARSASQSFATSMQNGAPNSTDRQDGNVIIGVDPVMLQKVPESSTREMKELGGMRLGMMAGAGTNTKTSTIDSMDLDEVLEDQRVVEPSGAVKRVGFAE